MPSNRSGGLREYTKNGALVVATVLAMALLAELLLSVGVRLFHPRITRVDPVVGWYHNSGVREQIEKEGHRYTASYNSRGYRSPEHSLTKPAGTRRVVVIGDSFLDGEEVGDDELLTWRLQQSLPGTEVVNLGVYGYQTTQELLTLQREGFQYDPDIVVLLVISNDIYGNLLGFDSFGPAPRLLPDGDSLRFESTNSTAAREAFRISNLPVPAWVHRHSMLYYVLNSRVYQRLAANRIIALQETRKRLLSPDEQVDLFTRIVHRMEDSCRARGVPLLVVFGYLREELKPGATPFLDAITRLSAAGVVTYDLGDSLRAAELKGPTLYYQNDIHWNAHGHDRVAAILAPVISRHLGQAPGTNSSAPEERAAVAVEQVR